MLMFATILSLVCFVVLIFDPSRGLFTRPGRVDYVEIAIFVLGLTALIGAWLTR